MNDELTLSDIPVQEEDNRHKNLATIQRIKSIESIENADAIEVVKFEDVAWQSVVRKNVFKVGELVVYITVDTILPDGAEWAQFLKGKDEHANEPIRLKSVTLRKCLSQGLVLPLSAIPGYERYTDHGVEREVIVGHEHGQEYETEIDIGDDMTHRLQIKKYEKPIPAQLAGQVKGNFPFWLRKTDESRLQSYPHVLDEVLGESVYITMKMDGSSMSAYFKDGEFGVCSRNLDLKETEGNAFWKMARELDLENKLKDRGNFMLQGELIGKGINGNHLGLDTIEFYAFNVWDIDNQKYLDFSPFLEFVKSINVKYVPMLYINYLRDEYSTIEQLIEFANRQVYPNGSPAEGIVVRPTTEKYSEALKGRLSFKVISNTFALKYGE